MKKLLSKKLKIDYQNDSLLEDSSIQKFIGIDFKQSLKSSKLDDSRTYSKFIDVKLQRNFSTSKKKIQLKGPSEKRISFFTKYSQSKELNSSKFMQTKSLRNFPSLSYEKLNYLKKMTSNGAREALSLRRYSVSTLKPKTEVQKLILARRKHELGDPFKQPILESEYI